jgi:hypothetical protein
MVGCLGVVIRWFIRLVLFRIALFIWRRIWGRRG